MKLQYTGQASSIFPYSRYFHPEYYIFFAESSLAHRTISVDFNDGKIISDGFVPFNRSHFNMLESFSKWGFLVALTKISPVRLERTTSGSGGQRSIQLSYGDKNSISSYYKCLPTSFTTHYLYWNGDNIIWHFEDSQNVELFKSGK